MESTFYQVYDKGPSDPNQWRRIQQDIEDSKPLQPLDLITHFMLEEVFNQWLYRIGFDPWEFWRMNEEEYMVGNCIGKDPRILL